MKLKNATVKSEDIPGNSDQHIDQDFPGFPHLPADKKSITPQTALEKKLAGANGKKSEKVYGG